MQSKQLIEQKIWHDMPEWIEDWAADIDVIRDIVQGGCPSGSYMPAVTYHSAKATMTEYGDEVMLYIHDEMLPYVFQNDANTSSFSGLCCGILSAAVEQWANDIFQEFEEFQNVMDLEDDSERVEYLLHYIDQTPFSECDPEEVEELLERVEFDGIEEENPVFWDTVTDGKFDVEEGVAC